MSDPEGSNDSTPLENSIDSAPAPPSERGPSTSAVQASGVQEPIPTRTVAPQVSAGQPFFGVMKQGANHYQRPFNDDYEARFPEDPYGEETAPNARVWRTLIEEAAAFDAVFVGQARDGLDVMLVFAGLFSAVVTSFLVQVSQSLQADYTAMSAILLYDLVAIQLSIAEGPSSQVNITAPSVNPMQTFRPDSITVWVNGLWVVSLTASLVVALSAVLIKQWLHHYTSIPSGTPGACSHLRQYRFIGLQKWRVSVVIGLLPIVMHTSLALFLAGLVLFFIPLRTSLACAVGIFTVALCLLYLVSSAMPIFFPQCPYQTPLTDFIHHTCLTIRKVSHVISRHARRLAYDVLSICRHWICCFLHLDMPDIKFSHVRSPSHSVECSSATLNQLERIAVESDYDKLSVDALDWLFNVSSNPTVHSLVVQAIGGLPPEVEVYARATWEGQVEINDVRDHLYLQSRGRRSVIGYGSVCERLIRSFCFISNRCYALDWEDFDEPRSMAAAWAAHALAEPYYYMAPDCTRDLRKFFCTFNELDLHPLIWVALVRSALAVNSSYHCFQLDSPEDLSGQDYAHIISLFLPASEVRDELSVGRSTGQRSAVTLHEALTFHLGDISESVQACLLNMLSSMDDDLPPMLPPRYRLLYKR
ncbi:hypothetical protein BDZ89DRAFT_1065206 [Hymenopellis radicata]|nr:hypothetical protein BDZ89DRAFT_1065206 [Hymenopellis radicata]